MRLPRKAQAGLAGAAVAIISVVAARLQDRPDAREESGAASARISE
jgi:hypothetical protein